MTEREKAIKESTEITVALNAVRFFVEKSKGILNFDSYALNIIHTLFDFCDFYNKLLSESLGREEKLEKEVAKLKEKLAQAKKKLATIEIEKANEQPGYENLPPMMHCSDI